MDLQYEHNRSFDRCADIAHPTDQKDPEKDYSLSVGDPFFAHVDSIGLKQLIQSYVAVIKNHHQNRCGVSADRRYCIFYDEQRYGGKLLLSDYV